MNYATIKLIKVRLFLLIVLACFSMVVSAQLYKLKDLESRAATAENPTAEKGKGGMTKNGLKGDPAVRNFTKGSTVTLLNTKGPGMVRHIWCTFNPNNRPEYLRNVILQMYWEHSNVPSVEVPLSDFFGMSHGAKVLLTSQLVSIQPSLGYNCDIPMPFGKHALITVTNDTDVDIDWFFYQIDFTLGDKIAKDDGRFHASFSRENPTKYGRDFTIMQTEGAKGVFLGCTVGIRSVTDGWWGEGEVKIYLDSDTRYPTICGTGIEDYFGAAWGLKEHCAPYRGAPLVEPDFCSMYRFHINDPVYFKNNIRVDVQQMGLTHISKARETYGDSLIFMPIEHPRRNPENVFYLRSDDVSAVAYWYQYPLIKNRKPLPNKATRSQNLYRRQTKNEPITAPM